MNRYVIYAVFLLAVCCSVNSQNDMDSFMEIDFQDFFKNDTVSLEINQYTIFKNVILNSDFSTGLTDIAVKVYVEKGAGFVKWSADSLEIENISNHVSVNVSLNGHLTKYLIDVDKGKYIGLSKKHNSKIEFYQSKQPFEYD